MFGFEELILPKVNTRHACADARKPCLTGAAIEQAWRLKVSAAALCATRAAQALLEAR